MKIRRLAGLLAVAATLLLPTLTSAAAPAPITMNLRPQGTAEVKVFTFCLERNKQFPKGDIRPAGLADPKVRAALAYAVANDYDQSQFFQTQLAIWYLVDNQWYDANHALAQQIVDAVNAGTAQPPALNEPGTAIGQAQANGQADIVISDLNNLNNTDYFGVGTLKVMNKTNANLGIYVPFGTVFPAPGTAFQNTMVYATQVLRADTAASANAGGAGGPSPATIAILLSGLGVMTFAVGKALRPAGS